MSSQYGYDVSSIASATAAARLSATAYDQSFRLERQAQARKNLAAMVCEYHGVDPRAGGGEPQVIDAAVEFEELCDILGLADAVTARADRLVDEPVADLEPAQAEPDTEPEVEPQPEEHGTQYGYYVHIRDGEEPCDSCYAAVFGSRR